MGKIQRHNISGKNMRVVTMVFFPVINIDSISYVLNSSIGLLSAAILDFQGSM